MVTAVTLIMWVVLADGSSTRTTKEFPSLDTCMTEAYKQLRSDHMMDGPDATFAAGCIVHQQRIS